MQWDEGVQAPIGEEFIVTGRPRGVPRFGRSFVMALVWHDQYEVRVDEWPRRARKAVWRVIVRRVEAERLVGELARLVSSGAWLPGEGDPPVAYTLRHQAGGASGR